MITDTLPIKDLPMNIHVFSDRLSQSKMKTNDIDLLASGFPVDNMQDKDHGFVVIVDRRQK